MTTTSQRQRSSTTSSNFALLVLLTTLGCGSDPADQPGDPSGGSAGAGAGAGTGGSAGTGATAGAGGSAGAGATAGAGGSGGGPPPNYEKYRKLGFLSVTLGIDGKPGATPDDSGDDTAAIQRSIKLGISQGMAVYFPPGEYRISDTLQGMMPVHKDKTGKYRQTDRRKPTVLIGSTRGSTRPVIKLFPKDSSFNDPTKPKPMIWLWAQRRDGANAGSTNPQHEQASISFSQVVRGIDLDLNAKPGAMGLRHACSQGCSYSDSRINATGAFAGIYNPAGQGGGNYNITIVGGKYGIYTTSAARYPIIAGAHFEDQEVAAIRASVHMPITLSGFTIKRSKPGPAIVLSKDYAGMGTANTLSLIDGRIELPAQSTAIENLANKNVFMKDVYFGGGMTEITKSGSKPAVKATGTWSHVKEYSYTGKSSESLTPSAVHASGHEILDISTNSPAPKPSATLRQRHTWTKFPSFEDPGFVVATDIDPKIVGDGTTDVTTALQAVITKHPKILLPRGNFAISDTLKLRSDTILLGVGKNFSRLVVGDPWVDTAAKPMLQTPNDPEGTTTVANIFLELNNKKPGASLVDWRVGRNSFFKGNFFGSPHTSTHASKNNGASLLIRQGGGGKWYGIAGEWTMLQPRTTHPDYRALLIDGTSQALRFYGLNIERVQSSVQSEIRNAKNVSIYYFKGESFMKDASGKFVKGPGPGLMRVTKTDNFQLFGLSGNAQPENQLMEVLESSNYVLANVCGVAKSPTYNAVVESSGGKTRSISGSLSAAMVRRGQPKL